jgi:predicted nuclease of predicted toxin-antitoxin system
MPRSIRFHLDEHLDHAIAEGLRGSGIEVTTTAQAGLAGTDDLTQLAFATSEDRVMVTKDDDFLRLHRQGVSHAGIAYSRQGTRSIGEILSGLILIWEFLEPDEMRDHVEYL